MTFEFEHCRSLADIWPHLFEGDPSGVLVHAWVPSAGGSNRFNSIAAITNIDWHQPLIVIPRPLTLIATFEIIRSFGEWNERRRAE